VFENFELLHWFQIKLNSRWLSNSIWNFEYSHNTTKLYLCCCRVLSRGDWYTDATGGFSHSARDVQDFYTAECTLFLHVCDRIYRHCRRM